MQKRKIILSFILAIIILFIGYFALKIAKTLDDNKKIDEEITKIKEEVIIEPKEVETDTDEEPQEEYKLPMDFNKLREINSDTVAWIKVDNTSIDYPIVKTSDNIYYLNHSFYKNENINGWIFENSSNSSQFTDDNTILFGHNTNGYTMFSELKNIYNGELGNTIYITIYLENEKINYQVFSIYLENPNSTSNISKYLNQDIINYMVDKSKIKTGVHVTEDDKILTLSTCNNVSNDRLVMHAKKM